MKNLRENEIKRIKEITEEQHICLLSLSRFMNEHQQFTSNNPYLFDKLFTLLENNRKIKELLVADL